MRTLEQFQKEVLAPLRKERDDKQDAAREIRSKAAADYMEANWENQKQGNQAEKNNPGK